MASYKLSEYEQARLDKIKRNEARLKSLGLDDAKKRVRDASRKRKSTSTKSPSNKRPRRVSASPTSPTRSSRRLKKKPVQYEPLMDDDLEIQLARKRFKAIKKQTRVTHTANTNFKCEIPNGVISSPLSKKEKEIIEKKMDGDFLAKFEDYVDTVDPLSDGNKRNVMRQVTKLVMGEGIRYESKAYGWPENCYFLKGTKVGPTDDILKLMDLGRECEDNWGRDHGNGWLLSHPLKKMYQFQQYHLLGKD